MTPCHTISFCDGVKNWLPKGSAFGIRHLLKKVDENFYSYILVTKNKGKKSPPM